MPQAPHRLHALDALRAAMMLLGLVLHTAVSYGAVHHGDEWPYHDRQRTVVADLVAYFIHLFRMPVFFLLAGFFAAMLHERRGTRGFLANRAVRIGVPFVAGWLLLYPAVAGGFTFANGALRGSLGEGLAALRSAGASLLLGGSTMHLWFLYDLLWFYAAALLLAALARRCPATWRATALGLFTAVASRTWLRPLPPAAITAATLWPMGGVLRTSTTFAPEPWSLLAYGVFFACGFVSWSQRDLLPGCRRGAWRQTLAAAGLFPVFVVVQHALVERGAPAAALVAVRSAGSALIAWWLAFGLLGLSLRYLDRPSALVRYLVDASYWVYLVHLPCTVWIPGLLANLDWSPFAKMAVVLAGTAVVAFASYDLLVRATWIGVLLNGRRHARGLPHAAGIPSAATAENST